MKIVEHTQNRLTLVSWQPEPAILMLTAGATMIAIAIVQPGPNPEAPNQLAMELMTLLFRGLFIFMGSLVGFAALVWVELVKRYTFDRDRNLFTIAARYCLRTSTTQYRLDRIRQVTSGPRDDDDDNHQAICMTLDTGRAVYASDVTQSSDREEYARHAEVIAAFLGV